MAIDLTSKYPGQVDTSDPTGYPYGKARNDLVAGDGTGTPLERDWLNDVLGFCQALLVEAGITPTGTPDKVGSSQMLLAIRERFVRSPLPDDGQPYTRLFTTSRIGGTVSLYVSDGGFLIAHNAEWQSGTGWVDVGAGGGSAYLLSPALNKLERLSGTIAAGAFPTVSDLSPIKAWAAIQLGTPQVLSGYNVTSVTEVASNTVDINLGVTFASFDDMNPMITNGGDLVPTVYIATKLSTSTIRVFGYDSTDGTQVDLHNGSREINFSIMGTLA